jgi:hypothetical protein
MEQTGDGQNNTDEVTDAECKQLTRLKVERRIPKHVLDQSVERSRART